MRIAVGTQHDAGDAGLARLAQLGVDDGVLPHIGRLGSLTAADRLQREHVLR